MEEEGNLAFRIFISAHRISKTLCFVVMKYRLLLVLLFYLLGYNNSHGQSLDIPGLTGMLNYEQFEVDTLLKKQGYLLLEKEVDSTSTLYYYTHLERSATGPSWVRSLTLIDASSNGFSSRLLRYRTYNKDEFIKLNAYLLANNYRSSGKFIMGNSEHVVYSNGKQEIRVKTIRNKLNDGRYIKSYEYELGK